jgi:broad specificity phosphatase PhoE
MLILVRHGRTEANAAGLLLGRADPPLDDVGRHQAASLAACLGEVTTVVTSPLRRAVETAEAFGAPIEVDDRWIELDYGSFDNKRWGEVGAEVWERWRSDPEFVPPGGEESLATVGARVAEACESLAGTAREGDVVVVSHVSPIKAAMAWALGVGVEVAWRSHLDPASITRVVVGDRGPVLRTFNETFHLT